MLTAVEHRFREASALADSPASRVAAPSRGGLPPGLTRRIRDYIESHLDGNVRLETLASLAGLSVHHFARAFRQSIGLSPHKYVLRRRIERARELLSQTDRTDRASRSWRAVPPRRSRTVIYSCSTAWATIPIGRRRTCCTPP
jgi:AraC-like DNA-binding protein